MRKKKYIPCTCPKGGIIEWGDGHETVCDKCGGTQWIEVTPKKEEK